MSDVELDDLRQRRDLFRTEEIEAVTGMHLEARLRRVCSAVGDAGEFAAGGSTIAGRQRFAPGAGMYLNYGSTD